MLQGFARMKWTLGLYRVKIYITWVLLLIYVEWGMNMKKIIILGLIVITSMMMAACGGKEKSKEGDKEVVEQSKEEVPATSGTDTADAGESGGSEAENSGIDGVSTLCTDDKSIRITVNRPEGFEDSEFSSEHQVTFQKKAESGDGSTQISLHLTANDENSVMVTAQQEVEYILSANSDGTGVVGEVQSQPIGNRQWSYFTYSLDDTEGLRLWTSLSNGCVVSCIVENMGTGLEPLNVESMLQILDGAIQE